MTLPLLHPATYIDQVDSLQRLVAELEDEPLLGIDTESNSLHAYRERVCLIQISSRDRDYIVDPLAIADMTPLKTLFADPNIEKVFHAAEYDLMCLQRDFGIRITNLFDTMIAARICGYKQVGLNNLLAQHLGVQLDKSHQRDDWGQRPLPEDSLRYAQMDTHYLPHLRDMLRAELESHGHLAEAEETFVEISLNTPAHDGRSFDPDGFWKIGMPNQLHPSEMAVLRELYLLREEIAEERDTPPFKVFSNKTLVDLARTMPTTSGEMVGIDGMSPAQIRRYNRHITDAIRRGRRATLPTPPSHRPPPQEVTDRYLVLHAWRKDKATARGVESDVIISKQALWDLADKVPTTMEALEAIPSIGPWRLQTYGEELLVVLRKLNGKHQSL
jgi:ribonuclease D